MTVTASPPITTAEAAEPPLMPLMQVYLRRKFFEPQHMNKPPPIAEQFLFDLRKMIGVARDRIRTRRHVPRLPPVVESEDEAAATAPATPSAVVASAIVEAVNEDIYGDGVDNSAIQSSSIVLPSLKNIEKESSSQQRICEKGGDNLLHYDVGELQFRKLECCEELAKEADKEDRELALSMEQIMREQQQQQQIGQRGESNSKNNNCNNDRNVLVVENRESESTNSSPRSSLDSGQGGSERHEEEGDVNGGMEIAATTVDANNGDEMHEAVSKAMEMDEIFGEVEAKQMKEGEEEEQDAIMPIDIEQESSRNLMPNIDDENTIACKQQQHRITNSELGRQRTIEQEVKQKQQQQQPNKQDDVVVTAAPPTGAINTVNRQTAQNQPSVPSRIPVGTATTSKSPKMHLKFAALTRRPPPLPRRPPPPPPSNSDADKIDVGRNGEPSTQQAKNGITGLLLPAAKRRTRDQMEQQQRSNGKSASATIVPLAMATGNYAVCPPPSYAHDRMKKSLPRRKKVIVPMDGGNSSDVPITTPSLPVPAAVV